jgi:porphobilinogen synthase
MDLPIRPRRNRKSPAIRGLCRETRLHPEQLVYPVFIQRGAADEPIDSMPGCTRWGVDPARGLLAELSLARELGVRAFILFPRIDDSLKSRTGDEAWNDRGLIPAVIRTIKRELPDCAVITDVALDPYNSDGHDGVVSPSGVVMNDETVDALCRQALCHARAGADVVAPSDMMDGRVAAIRTAMDEEGFTDVSILAYTAKYASAFYGPFRGALDSAPRPSAHVPADKKTYQMDIANVREALRELAQDELEGADMLMVKPAGPCLDVIRTLREATTLPLAAYQVSGEYLMIRSAAARGWLDERAAVLETLTGIARAGADLILTYFAPHAARWLAEQRG